VPRGNKIKSDELKNKNFFTKMTKKKSR